MKKFLLILALFATTATSAQNAWDALRYSQLTYQGTARSLGLGNAMTALGGDFGSLTINPAGSAVYPYSEFSFTPSVNSVSLATNVAESRFLDSYSRAGISSIGYVGSTGTGRGRGLVQMSFAAGYNKVQDFTSRSTIRFNDATSSWLTPVAMQTDGITSTDLETTDLYDPYYDSSAAWRSILAWDTYLLDLLPGTSDQYMGATENLNGDEISVGGLLDQRYSKETKGSIGEYLLNMGLNFSDKFFFGASATFQNIFYQTYKTYSEITQDASQFQTGLLDYTYTYEQLTQGMGFNMKFGIIALPTKNLRLGFTYTTPTWTSLSEEWQETISASYSNGPSEAGSPLGTFDYRVRTPMHIGAGIAYTFGNAGLLSVDYEGIDYRTMRMTDPSSYWTFDQVNQDIQNGSGSNNFLFAQNVRAGLEIRLSPVVLRAGYSYYGKVESTLLPTHIVSGGLGYRSGGSFFADFTVSYRLPYEDSYEFLYDLLNVSDSFGYKSLKVLGTIGFRF